MGFAFDWWALGTMVCMNKLHNLCIDQNVEMPSWRNFCWCTWWWLMGSLWHLTIHERTMFSYVVEPQVIIDKIKQLSWSSLELLDLHMHNVIVTLISI